MSLEAFKAAVLALEAAGECVLYPIDYQPRITADDTHCAVRGRPLPCEEIDHVQFFLIHHAPKRRPA
jgi:hypothetical protein